MEIKQPDHFFIQLTFVRFCTDLVTDSILNNKYTNSTKKSENYLLVYSKLFQNY